MLIRAKLYPYPVQVHRELRKFYNENGCKAVTLMQEYSAGQGKDEELYYKYSKGAMVSRKWNMSHLYYGHSHTGMCKQEYVLKILCYLAFSHVQPW